MQEDTYSWLRNVLEKITLNTKNSDEFIDKVIDIYDTDLKERRYIDYVIDVYRSGKLSEMEAHMLLKYNVVEEHGIDE